MATMYGNAASSYWRTCVNYSFSEDTYNFYVWAEIGIYFDKSHSHASSNDRPVYLTCAGTTYNFYPTWTHQTKKAFKSMGSASWTITKTTSTVYYVLTGYVGRAGGSAASVGFNVGPRPYYIDFNANGGTGTIPRQLKTADTALTLTTTIPTYEGFIFLGWNTASDGSGDMYESGGTLPASFNQDAILYAIWGSASKTKLYVKSNGIWYEGETSTKINNSWKKSEKIGIKSTDWIM